MDIGKQLLGRWEVSLLDQGSQGKQSFLQLKQDETKLYILLELVTKGSLESLYLKYLLRNSQVSVFTRQILSGLKYLHDRNVLHRAFRSRLVIRLVDIILCIT
ncbi:putative mitogen-activated protein kinase kinase kinase STE-STE11 family [Rosa chinensis]|uniref:Putative mitogen-activated protein kinase kinase kinase STE-STE11 family n=1 Tax=Rosa chinensis TaxID=74649 RepID=A0A2P6SA75_ROSCH|nr:putative mitogen-activated protein kinase kinase kinase STE-STE11 family [Rosa chinensis]